MGAVSFLLFALSVPSVRAGAGDIGWQEDPVAQAIDVLKDEPLPAADKPAESGSPAVQDLARLFLAEKSIKPDEWAFLAESASKNQISGIELWMWPENEVCIRRRWIRHLYCARVKDSPFEFVSKHKRVSLVHKPTQTVMDQALRLEALALALRLRGS